jgi:hypothetical protein
MEPPNVTVDYFELQGISGCIALVTPYPLSISIIGYVSTGVKVIMGIPPCLAIAFGANDSVHGLSPINSQLIVVLVAVQRVMLGLVAMVTGCGSSVPSVFSSAIRVRTKSGLLASACPALARAMLCSK